MPHNARLARILALLAVLAAATRRSPAAEAPPPEPTPLLLHRMQLEAHRVQLPVREQITISDREEDPFAAGLRSDQARRIFTKSVRGLATDRLETYLRTVPGLMRFLDRADHPGAARIESSAGDASPATGRLSSDAAIPPDPVSVRVGFHLDAHPRVVLRTRLFNMTGLIEVPVLDRDFRMALEQSLGPRARAVFRGGRSSEQGEWATLAFTLRY